MQIKINYISQQKKYVVLARLVMGFILLALLFRLAIQVMNFNFSNPPLFNLGLEISFRLFKLLHFDDLLVYSHLGSILFIAALFSFAVLAFIFPRRGFLFFIFSILFFLYYLSYNTFTIQHSHLIAFMVWITVPFWANKSVNRDLLWAGLRYYACFVYVVSFIFKVTGGSIFYWNNGVNSVKWNLAEYLFYHPETITSKVLTFGIQHPYLLNAGHLIVILLEGVMVVGFFTRRYDKWLILIPVIVHLSTYLFSDVFFIEMFVLLFLFLSDRQVAWINQKIPVLSK